jgi:putative ATPase
VTDLMRRMGHGQGYKYAHDYPDHFVKQQNLPSSLQGKRYYVPTEQGYEKEIADRLKKWWGESHERV